MIRDYANELRDKTNPQGEPAPATPPAQEPPPHSQVDMELERKKLDMLEKEISI